MRSSLITYQNGNYTLEAKGQLSGIEHINKTILLHTNVYTTTLTTCIQASVNAQLTKYVGVLEILVALR